MVLAAGQDEPVGGLGAAQRPHAQLAVLEDLAVPDDDLGPGRALGVKRSQPTRFCPKSTSVLPDGDDQMATGRASCRTTGGADVRREPAVSKSSVSTPPQPGSAARVQPVPSASRASMVCPSYRSFASSHGPARHVRRCSPLPVTVGVRHLQLGGDRQAVTVEGAVPVPPQPPAAPAVPQGDAQDVGPQQSVTS